MIRKDTPHRFPPKSLPRADRAWKHFESGLAHVLPDLARGDCLIVSHRTADIFVQFVGDGRDGMRAEAISNDYVTKGQTVICGRDPGTGAMRLEPADTQCCGRRREAAWGGVAELLPGP